MRKRKNKQKKIFPLILAGAGLLLMIGAAIMFKPGLEPEPTPGNSANNGPSGFDSVVPATVEIDAPDLALTSIDGNVESLDDYKGQVILVNNWATWCPPCRAEMPELEAYYQSKKNNGFVLIGISAGDPADQVQSFIADYDLTFPMWLDPTMKSLDAFNARSLPSSFVIDQTGTIRLAWTGAISLDMLEKHVTPLLEN